MLSRHLETAWKETPVLQKNSDNFKFSNGNLTQAVVGKNLKYTSSFNKRYLETYGYFIGFW
jgi:hypothetical protein